MAKFPEVPSIGPLTTYQTTARPQHEKVEGILIGGVGCITAHRALFNPYLDVVRYPERNDREMLDNRDETKQHTLPNSIYATIAKQTQKGSLRKDFMLSFPFTLLRNTKTHSAYPFCPRKGQPCCAWCLSQLHSLDRW